MNDIFKDYLNNFVIIYINNLLIFSNTLKEYKCHIHLIFEKLCKIDFYLKFQKYQFIIQKIIFLKYLIELKNIKMNSKKINMIIA